MAEDAWNSRDPGTRRRSPIPRTPVAQSLGSVPGPRHNSRVPAPQMGKELDYRLIKDLWAFDVNRIAVRFQYEWHDDSGQWYRSYGNEKWEFDEHGLMRRREASINDIAIAEQTAGFTGQRRGRGRRMCRGWERIRSDYLIAPLLLPLLLGGPPKTTYRLTPSRKPRPSASSPSTEARRIGDKLSPQPTNANIRLIVRRIGLIPLRLKRPRQLCPIIDDTQGGELRD